MKKSLLLTGAMLSASLAFADYRAVFFTDGAPVSQTKVSNIKQITADGKNVSQEAEDNTKLFEISKVDSVLFLNDTVFVQYSGTSAVVASQLAPLGLNVVATGADVKVVADESFDLKDMVFVLSGSSSNGSFVMNQNKRVSVVFDNLSLTSQKSAPVAFVGDKAVALELRGVNVLADSPARVAGDSLDAALYVYDDLSVSGIGSLAVSGNMKKGIFVKDDFTVDGGSISISALTSAVRVKDNFVLNNGSMVLSNSETSIDANDSIIINDGKLVADAIVDESKCLSADGAYIQKGGDVQLSLTGASARGVKIGSVEISATEFLPGNVAISGGNLIVAVSSEKATSVDPPKPAAIKSDGSVTISGGSVKVSTTTGSHSVRGIAADGVVVINGSAVVELDIQSAKGTAWCIKSDDISVKDGCLTATFNEANKKFASNESGYFSSDPVSVP